MVQKLPPFLFIFYLFFVSFSVLGQAQERASLLWKISKKGVSNSYLFGTIHLVCPSDFQLSDTLQSCLKETNQLILELDMDDPGMMLAMTRTMLMSGNNKLSALLSGDDYLQVSQFYRDSLGIPISLFDGVKPFISMSMAFNKVLNCEPVSYEMKLMELAKAQKKEIKGLETVEEQMAVFDSISYRDQADMLLQLIQELPKARREFASMAKLYREQDLEGLYAATQQSDFDLKGKEDVLLAARNRRWIEQMQVLLPTQSAFYAVGAAHLPGAEGLIALLRKKGFTVEAVR
jgi:uncharacterized protein YbaP (TraB family)